MSFARNFFLGSYQGSPLALPPEPPPPDPDPVAQTRGMITALSGAGSAAYNGRYLVNELVATLPTKNLLTYAYYDRNENGTNSPARTLHYATDPLGGSNVTRLQFTAVRQQHVWFRASEGDIPAGSYDHRTYVLAESAGTAYRLGASNTATKYGTITPTGSLAAYDFTVTGYADGYDLGISSDAITANSYIQVYCQQLYATGDTIPTLAEEAAGYNGHAKKAFAFPGSITFDADGGIESDATKEGLIVALPNFPAPTTFTDLTVYMAISVTGYPTGTVGNAICVDYSPSSDLNTSNLKFQMGIGASPGTGPGTLYTWPIFATNGGVVGGSWFDLVGRGWVVVAMSLSSVAGTASGEGVTVYLGGVPIIISATAFAGLQARAFRALSYNGVLKARASASRFIGAGDHIWIGSQAHGDAEVLEHTRYIEGLLEDEGKSLIPKDPILGGGGDSITQYSVSWAWQGAQDAGLIAAGKSLFLNNEAIGGSSLYGAGTGFLVRESRLARRILAAVAQGHDYYHVLLIGANELAHWRDSTIRYDYTSPCPDSVGFNADGSISTTPTTARSWMTDFTAYVNRQRARGAKVIIGYMLPRSGFGGAPYSAASLEAEAARQSIMNYWDANHATLFDGRIQFGRHPVMGDYAVSAAAYTGDTAYYLNGGTHPTYGGHTLLWNDPNPANADYCAKPFFEPLL